MDIRRREGSTLTNSALEAADGDSGTVMKDTPKKPKPMRKVNPLILKLGSLEQKMCVTLPLPRHVNSFGMLRVITKMVTL